MLALVFPGQGSQTVGMGRDVAKEYPIARETFEQADEALGFPISKLCFDGPETKLQLTANSQPAILTTSIATLRALQQETGATPDVVAGHSLGEYSALVCANAMSFEDAVRVVNKRGEFMQEAVPEGEGAMAAVMGVEWDVVEQLCQDASQGRVLSPANFNAPTQIVISGHVDAVDRAVELARERRAIAKKLKVSAPFHCSLMKPAAEKLAAELKAIVFTDPDMPVICNVDATPNLASEKIADLLIQQVTAPVRWVDSVRQMVEMGVQETIEVGCGKALSGMIRRIEKALLVGNAETPTHIEALQWASRPDGTKVKRDGTHVIWPDGMEWSFHDPSAHGF